LILVRFQDVVRFRIFDDRIADSSSTRDFAFSDAERNR